MRPAVGPPGRRQRRAGGGARSRARGARAPGSAVRELRDDGDAVELAASGAREHFDRAVLALPLPLGLALAPALRERPSYARLVFGVASKLHVPLAAPTPPVAVQSLEAAFWTWTASGVAGTPSTIASSFAGGARAQVALAIERGAERWRSAVLELRPELLPAEGAVLTRWGDEQYAAGSYACHPPGWSQRDDEAVAAPLGRIHLAGEHTAAEFCGTLEGALRSGARAASEVLAEAGSRS